MSRFMQGVNLEEVPELQPVPDGTLIIEVEGWEEKKSQNNNPMAIIACTIIAPDEVAKKVGKYYLRIPMMNSTLFRWKAIYKACGIMELAQDGFDPDDLIGKQMGIVVTLREYQGQPRNQEQKFLPVDQTEAVLHGKWEDVDAIEAGGSSSAGAEGGEGGGLFGG